jgi:hypothetical protein
MIKYNDHNIILINLDELRRDYTRKLKTFDSFKKSYFLKI